MPCKTNLFLHRNIHWSSERGQGRSGAPRLCWLCPWERKEHLPHLLSWQSSCLKVSELLRKKLNLKSFDPTGIKMRFFYRWSSKSQTWDKPRKVTTCSNRLYILQQTGYGNLMLVACVTRWLSTLGRAGLGCPCILLDLRHCPAAFQILFCVALVYNHISSCLAADSSSSCVGHLKYQWSL